MKEFKPTYLYVKTHNGTGLKYFGKTVKDPHKYFGSGKYWVRHLEKYGRDVTTEILGFFTNAEECRAAALKFSVENKIVESSEWANIVPENGLDGGDTGGKRVRQYIRSAESIEKWRKSYAGTKAWNKGTKGLTPGNKTPRSKETREKISKGLSGLRQSPETIAKRVAAITGQKRTPEQCRNISLGKMRRN